MSESWKKNLKKNQKKLNLFEQSVITHELVHSLQGQIIDLSAWYYEMKDADDFSDYYGRRSIMEAQADIIQERWEGGLDSYDRQTLQSQYPAGCGVSLPEYFYIPIDLYYGYGGILGKEIYNNGGMEALNEALYLLPTPEQVYEPEKYFSGEIYDDIEISDLAIEGYSLVDEGKFNSLDLVYLLQGNIGQKQAVEAAVGLNGGSWKDYQDAEGKLFMSVKLNGDNSTELSEIHEAFIDWAEAQERFIAYTTADFTGNLFIGELTSFWIENDGEFVRILLAIDQNLLKDILSNCSSGPCKQDF